MAEHHLKAAGRVVSRDLVLIRCVVVDIEVQLIAIDPTMRLS